MQSLILLYFTNFSDIHFMFEQSLFLRQMTLGNIPKVILLSMMALGIRFSHAPFQDPEMRARWGEPLMEEARGLLQVKFDDPSVTTAQAHILQATYHWTFGGTRKAWLNLSHDRNILSVLYIQDDLDLLEPDPIQAELSRRLLATVTLMEYLLLPFSRIERAHLPVRNLPRICTEDEFTALKGRSHQPKAATTTPNVMQEILVLADIYYKVCHARGVEGVSALRTFHTSLSEWHRRLPEALKETIENFEEFRTDFNLRPYIFLHLLYHHIWQLTLLDSLPWTSQVMNGHGTQQSWQLPVHEHASAMVNLVRKMWDMSRMLVHNPCFGQALSIAQVVLTHRLITSTDFVEKSQTQSDMIFLRESALRAKESCRLYNWVFHQTELFLRVCGQDGFYLHENWNDAITEQLMTTGTRFERLDIRTSGRHDYLERIASQESLAEHQSNVMPKLLTQDFLAH